MYINGRWTEDPDIIDLPSSIASRLWFDNILKYLDVSDPQKLTHEDFRVATYRAVHKYLDDVLLPHQQHLRSKVLGEWLIKVGMSSAGMAPRRGQGSLACRGHLRQLATYSVPVFGEGDRYRTMTIAVQTQL